MQSIYLALFELCRTSGKGGTCGPILTTIVHHYRRESPGVKTRLSKGGGPLRASRASGLAPILVCKIFRHDLRPINSTRSIHSRNYCTRSCRARCFCLFSEWNARTNSWHCTDDARCCQSRFFQTLVVSSRTGTSTTAARLPRWRITGYLVYMPHLRSTDLGPQTPLNNFRRMNANHPPH